MVNLQCQHDGTMVARHLCMKHINIILAVSGRAFLDDMKTESVDRVKQIALPSVVGLAQSPEGLSRTKRSAHYK